MKISYLQHVPFEGPARIAEWAALREHHIAGTRLDLGHPLPGISDFDMLVILGGPMSVNDSEMYPWLGRERQLVRDAMIAKKPILGVCLGAQLIASSLGSRIYSAEKEIGWFGVKCEPLSCPSVFAGNPNSFIPLHWHGETFDLPPAAQHLASSEACQNQAFQVGDRVVGLQFHLEASLESVDAMLENAAGDITGGPFQQQPEQIRALAASQIAALWPLLDATLSYLAQKVER